MWNEKKSTRLSQCIVGVFAICLLAAMVTAPCFTDWFIQTRTIDLSGTKVWFLISFYSACIPAAVLLYCLFRLLDNISQGRVFIPDNTRYLRLTSWCCVAAAVICIISTFYYVPFLLVAIAAGFMALIIRVIKNVFSRAILLQDDADYTI